MPVPTSSKDKRLIKASGIYDTREELVEVCKAMRETDSTFKAIADATGVSPCTVKRIIKGDKPTYGRSGGALEDPEPIGTDSKWLNQHWVIPQSIGEEHESRI